MEIMHVGDLPEVTWNHELQNLVEWPESLKHAVGNCASSEHNQAADPILSSLSDEIPW